MDDYDITTLIESKNEWCARLLNILTPQIILGFKSIFSEAEKLCIENDEEEKYLMTFQNLLVNIPKWSQNIVETECKRIINITNCNYIEDLISCVHIIQLKALTACRVGLKQKKINIEIPNLNNFIHQVYINCARKLYLNIYLFETNILPLQLQKNNREIEIIIKEIILNTVRDNIPMENLLRAYLDETEETETIVEERKETVIDKEKLELEKARIKMKQEFEQQKEIENKNIVENNKKEENKDLEKLSAEIESIRKDLPDLDIREKQQTISLGKDTTMDKDTIIDKEDSEVLTNNSKSLDNDDSKSLDNDDSKSLDSNSKSIDSNINEDILEIDNNIVDDVLEITDLDSIDNIEPDISLDIEEL